MTLPSHSTRIAMAASPAPRNTALMRNSSTTVMLPPSIIRVKPLPLATTRGEAPIILSKFVPCHAPKPPIRHEMKMPMRIVCAAARDAPSASRSPVRRATSAEAPIDSPIATV